MVLQSVFIANLMVADLVSLIQMPAGHPSLLNGSNSKNYWGPSILSEIGIKQILAYLNFENCWKYDLNYELWLQSCAVFSFPNIFIRSLSTRIVATFNKDINNTLKRHFSFRYVSSSVGVKVMLQYNWISFCGTQMLLRKNTVHKCHYFPLKTSTFLDACKVLDSKWFSGEYMRGENLLRRKDSNEKNQSRAG